MKIRNYTIKKRWVILFVLVVYLGGVAFYQDNRPLPKGVPYEGRIHNSGTVEFLNDVTYENEQGKRVSDQEIFQRIYKSIEEAEDFIVLDFFMISDYKSTNIDFPPIADTLTSTLIAQMENKPDLDVYFITDEINTSYNSYSAKHLARLKEAGAQIVFTDVDQLRDSNPLYSAVWRTFFQWFGQSGPTWLSNPFAKDGPDVTFRSYLKLLNLKANHRKIAVTEKSAIISSANPHDESGYHSNIAFRVTGPIINDILESEEAISAFSGGPKKLPRIDETKTEEGSSDIQFLTEQKIEDALLAEISKMKEGDTIWFGAFYLADRELIEALKRSAEKGVQIKLILDPNQNAFGHEKTGLPNIPVAEELSDIAEIRWYNTDKEQYHSKIAYFTQGNRRVVIGGSANFTARNLDNYNLEADLFLSDSADAATMKDVDAYFKKLWSNQDGIYTLPYEKHESDLAPFQYVIYRLQKFLRFTTF